MNPVENKQPSECSEWAMKKAKDLSGDCTCSFMAGFSWDGVHRVNCLIMRIAKELDSLKAEKDDIQDKLDLCRAIDESPRADSEFKILIDSLKVNDAKLVEENKLLKSQADGLAESLASLIDEFDISKTVSQRKSLEAYRKGE